MVYLVGAGPGDPGLLTVKAHACLKKADTVVYDYLADSRILALVPEEAERIYVGKSAGNHAMKQEDISKLLVKLSREGKCVVRLKGGDPFVFGRGGQAGDIGKGAAKTRVVVEHGGDLGLLQHDFRQPHAVGVGALPGQAVAAVAALPADQARGELAADGVGIGV